MKIIGQGFLGPTEAMIEGQPVDLTSLSKRQMKRIDWSQIDLSHVDLREWHPTEPGAYGAVRRELQRRIPREKPAPEGGVLPPGTAELRAQLAGDPNAAQKFLVHRSDNETRTKRSAVELREHRAKIWSTLPGYVLPERRGSRLRPEVYRGENLLYAPEEPMHLAAIWSGLQRRKPTLAAKLRVTPFPPELWPLVHRSVDFEHQGVTMRAIVVKDGRLFFAAPTI